MTYWALGITNNQWWFVTSSNLQRDKGQICLPASSHPICHQTKTAKPDKKACAASENGEVDELGWKCILHISGGAGLIIAISIVLQSLCFNCDSERQICHNTFIFLGLRSVRQGLWTFLVEMRSIYTYLLKIFALIDKSCYNHCSLDCYINATKKDNRGRH